MHWFIEFGAWIIVGFLTISNGLAATIEQWLPNETINQPDLSALVNETPGALTKLDSQYRERWNIPDILLRNAPFQGANVATGDLTDSPQYAPEEALVNIFCTYTTEDYRRTTTGSGFFISRSGAVLTNAHVAQFLLLESSENTGTTECILRTGSPATSTYEARLLYIPPAWIQANAVQIDDAAPIGTGERDYALLYASRRLDNAPLPVAFPHLALNTKEFSPANEGDVVVPYGYPATPLQEQGAEAELLQVHAPTSISEFFTFTEQTADVISIRESIASRKGASGGPVVNTENQAVGVIVAQGESEADSMRALTASYINRTIQEETGFALTDYVAGDLARRATVFENALEPFLQQILERELRE